MKQSTSRERRAWMAWYFANGQNAAATCRHFNISRSTFYRWLKRFNPAQPQKPLKSRSRRPHTKRRPTWSLYHLAVLSDVMSEHPGWGRKRLQVALAAKGWLVSEATVGRMAQGVRRQCPVCRGREGQHSVGLHLLQQDLTDKGLRMPPTVPPPVPRPRASRRRIQSAIGQAEEVIRRGKRE
jgi:transposase